MKKLCLGNSGIRLSAQDCPSKVTKRQTISACGPGSDIRVQRMRQEVNCSQHLSVKGESIALPGAMTSTFRLLIWEAMLAFRLEVSILSLFLLSCNHRGL